MIIPITKLLESTDSYEQICVACRQKIEKGFSSKVMIGKLEKIFEDLVNDTAAAEKRKAIAAKLQEFGHLIEDHFILYRLDEEKHAEAEEVWQSREWFRNLYEEAVSKVSSVQTSSEMPAEMMCKATLELYKSGKVGFRYIIQYIVAWVKYKLFGEKT